MIMMMITQDYHNHHRTLITQELSPRPHCPHISTLWRCEVFGKQRAAKAEDLRKVSTQISKDHKQYQKIIPSGK